ncbi:Glycerophosphodiester phosphodiesterase GDPD4, partial [Linum perenne]
LSSFLQIKELDVFQKSALDIGEQKIPTIVDALKLVSSSVRQVILDAKVGPPSYEDGLAKDILSIVKRSKCTNCVVWAKSDSLARDVIKLTSDVMVGYIVMVDPNTGRRNDLLRIKEAGVVGIYHRLVNERLVRLLHGRQKKVYTWTVDEIESMRMMLMERVDAIVTNRPSSLQQLIQDIRSECREEGFSLPR